MYVSDYLTCISLHCPCCSVFWSYCRWSQFAASSRWSSRSHSLRRKSGRLWKIRTLIGMTMTMTMTMCYVINLNDVGAVWKVPISLMVGTVGGWIENWCKSLTHRTWNTALSKSRPACNDPNKSGEEQIMRDSHPAPLLNDQTWIIHFSTTHLEKYTCKNALLK